MAVRQRNLSTGAQQRVATLDGRASSADLPQLLWVGARTSYQVHEATIIVVNCNAGTTTTGTEAIAIRMIDNDLATAGTVIASISVPGGTTLKTEYTTRDGSLTWAAGYQNVADRVFAKGTGILVLGDAGSADLDTFGCSVAVSEYGAPPQ